MTHTTRGNVFLDLGFDSDEAADLAIKAEIMTAISLFIENTGMRQATAARFFGVPQPKISKIMNGKMDELSTDYLIKILPATGGRISFGFKQPRKDKAQRLIRARLAVA